MPVNAFAVAARAAATSSGASAALQQAGLTSVHRHGSAPMGYGVGVGVGVAKWIGPGSSVAVHASTADNASSTARGPQIVVFMSILRR